MKNIISVLVIMLVIISSSNAQEIKEEKTKFGKFLLTVSGFDSDDGKAMIALFNSEESYSETGERFKFVAAEIIDSKAEWLIEGLAFGEYAIKLYHDENGNQKMDRNMLGIPSEDYGFSNNATGSFGPADYEDAKFIFEDSGQKHEITIE